jgi:hypothetical protein
MCIHKATLPARNEKPQIARLAYQHIWQQSAGGGFSTEASV